MCTHNICLRREIRKILCGYPFLSVAMFHIPIGVLLFLLNVSLIFCMNLPDIVCSVIRWNHLAKGIQMSIYNIYLQGNKKMFIRVPLSAGSVFKNYQFFFRIIGSSNILSWGLIMKYFLLSFFPFCWFKKGSFQLLVWEYAQVLVNRLGD